MQILAHRGFWKSAEEKNSLSAFERAFKFGYGIETDVRDYLGKLVVSHNIADENSPLFEDVLRIYKESKSNQYLAINIKADGLQGLLGELLAKYEVEKYFVFDMSIPELVAYRNKGINYFTRMSDYEREPVLLDDAMGIWMDEWITTWISLEEIRCFSKQNKAVGVISPEIHGRNERKMWDFIREIDEERLLLCTDRPDLFEGFCNRRS